MYPQEILNAMDYIIQTISNDRCLLESNFSKCILGYHLINSSPINQTLWEDVNSIIFTHSNIKVFNKSNGSHLSGMDIKCSFGNISNKSCKYLSNKSFIDISSYRLTTVCNNSNFGNPNDFINEINKRKNFDYYSILIRDEDTSPDYITYNWLLIPSDYYLLIPSTYSWYPYLGKSTSNNNKQVGWITNTINGSYMKIIFSMSSQLWIHLKITSEIKKYIIASTTIKKMNSFDFITLFDKLSN